MANVTVYTVDVAGLILLGGTAREASITQYTVATADFIVLLGTSSSCAVTAFSGAGKSDLVPYNKTTGGTGTSVYYKMCARSLDNTSWQTWTVFGTPDFSGTQYGGVVPINTSTIYILATI
jgi:hypothetical protein